MSPLLDYKTALPKYKTATQFFVCAMRMFCEYCPELPVFFVDTEIE
jgi:hypothetical protein